MLKCMCRPLMKPSLCNNYILALWLQGFFESIFSVWPISKLFELNGSIHEWWFRWKLDRFVSQMCFLPLHPTLVVSVIDGRVDQTLVSLHKFSKLCEIIWCGYVLLQAVIHGMLFAFIYLVLQKRQGLSEGKGEALFSAKISNLLLFLSVVSFIVRLFTLAFSDIFCSYQSIKHCLTTAV